MPPARILAALGLTLLAGCGGSSTTGTNNNSDTYEIQGAAMSGYAQNIRVTHHGAAATGLTVTVNGEAMAEISPGTYGGHLATGLPSGSAIEVRASNGTLTAVGDAVVPAQPIITNESHTTIGNPVTVSWSVASQPDSFIVTLNYHLPDNSALAVLVRLGGSARQATIPTTDIPANGTVFSLGIDAVVHGSFHGDAASTSDMHVRTSGGTDLTIP
jgi:hypothetical protein